MRLLKVLILAVVAIVYAGGIALATHAGNTTPPEKRMQEHTFTQHYENSLFQVTQKGLYSIELLIKNRTLFVGSNSIDVIIHDRDDRDVTGAKISITPWMPDMGHEVPEAPEITERGGGRYTAKMVKVSKPGLWELRFTVEASSGTDTAIFSFPDVTMREKMGEEGMDHSKGMENMSGEMGAPKGINYSNVLKSQKGLFTVSYKAQDDNIPVGRIHQWVLDITDKDGNPVDGAEVEVSGAMPAHGHGMPTSPEASPEGKGRYLIEGMEFSMPGYWTVTVKVKKNGMEDSATFNLDLK